MNPSISPLGELGSLIRDLLSVGGVIGGLVLLYRAYLERKKPKADIDHTDADTGKIKADATAVTVSAMLNVISQIEKNAERVEQRNKELESEVTELEEWKRASLPELARLRQYDKLSERSKGDAE